MVHVYNGDYAHAQWSIDDNLNSVDVQAFNPFTRIINEYNNEPLHTYICMCVVYYCSYYIFEIIMALVYKGILIVC